MSAEPGLCGKLQEANTRRASDFKGEAPEGRKVGVRDECDDSGETTWGKKKKAEETTDFARNPQLRLSVPLMQLCNFSHPQLLHLQPASYPSFLYD